MKDDPSPSGIRHLDILRRVAKGHVACIGNNHIVPVLQELTNDEHGLTFIVQPKLFDIDEFPTWYTAREAADFVVQILEGLDFCHRRLIAHLDIGYGNILSNFRGGAKFPVDYTRGDPYPFRSHFPVRYYLNDFEIGLSFDENSDPFSRLITGIPWTASGREGTYGRPIAPEMTKPDVPYCPFRADVWQLGTLMKSEDCEFENVGGLPEYQSLLDEMVAEDPLARPIMSEALRRARELRLTLPEDL
ncbi:uncharacterized protein STEHIDRAFT_157651 [Stereum hirsutum FP-91666 SS1]|uniref:uncharacterized protein n=1 Tax=Stereum hirsutum (strain FP-91666) TaxID=721885 RepID=UPI000444A669|nr:uncharacterized protein STEHIDRAFT_157651 [Stereum hirsutum FP-91666 SS1]EIM86144.1 hypothetical protein STEHIDRAFT_157651 [Stereum hirsutum FP-91666 SS1]